MKLVCVLVLERASVPIQTEKLAVHFLNLSHNSTGKHQPHPGVRLHLEESIT